MGSLDALHIEDRLKICEKNDFHDMTFLTVVDGLLYEHDLCCRHILLSVRTRCHLGSWTSLIR